MIGQMAKRLFMRVYHPLTAVISMKGENQVLGLILLDTLFPTTEGCVSPEADLIYVIFNHPDGRQDFIEHEREIAGRIAQDAPGREIRVLLYGEDIGLMAVDSGEILRYNGENAV